MKAIRAAAPIFLALLAIQVSVIAEPAAAATHPTKAAASSLLFVQETDGGALERVRPGVFRLRLDGVSPSVSTFTDRPRRRAGVQAMDRFVGSWGQNGFAADPPNAALVLAGAPASRDVAMVTLSHPRYDRRDQTLSYLVKPLHGDPLGSLAGLAKRGDPLVPHRFGHASLFIDDSGGARFVPVTLRFTNLEPGQMVTVHASTEDQPLSWSFQPPSGQFIFKTSGAPVPLENLQIIGGTLILDVGWQPEPLTFSISLYLEADQPVTSFFLSANHGGLSTVITAQLGGEEEQPVNQSQTPFFWPDF